MRALIVEPDAPHRGRGRRSPHRPVRNAAAAFRQPLLPAGWANARTGAEAILRCEQFRPDVLLLDLHLADLPAPTICATASRSATRRSRRHADRTPGGDGGAGCLKAGAAPACSRTSTSRTSLGADAGGPRPSWTPGSRGRWSPPRAGPRRATAPDRAFGELAIEVDQLLGNRLPFGRVGVQQRRRAPALQNRRELPSQVEGVLHGHVHALPGLRAVGVTGVPGDEDTREAGCPSPPAARRRTCRTDAGQSRRRTTRRCL